ncbi:MAG: Na+/H+ antiporter NhaA, partial [Mycobacterium sp.]
MKPGENAAAGLLLLATLIAILWANSPWAESYWSLLDTHVGVAFGGRHFDMSV